MSQRNISQEIYCKPFRSRHGNITPTKTERTDKTRKDKKGSNKTDKTKKGVRNVTNVVKKSFANYSFMSSKLIF